MNTLSTTTKASSTSLSIDDGKLLTAKERRKLFNKTRRCECCNLLYPTSLEIISKSWKSLDRSFSLTFFFIIMLCREIQKQKRAGVVPNEETLQKFREIAAVAAETREQRFD